MADREQPQVAESIAQAALILESAYALVIRATDPKTLKVDELIFENVDHNIALKHLSKIATICRRLEFELAENYNSKNGSSIEEQK